MAGREKREQGVNPRTAVAQMVAQIDLVPERDILDRAIPADGPRSGIYFLIRDNRVVYVGKSLNINGRVPQHAPSKIFDSWAWLPYPAEDLIRIERAYIDVILPEYNMDSRTRRLRKEQAPTVNVSYIICETPWVQVIQPDIDVCEEDDIDDDARRREWMLRIRAVKANPKLKIDDFGISPFSKEWQP